MRAHPHHTNHHTSHRVVRGAGEEFFEEGRSGRGRRGGRGGPHGPGGHGPGGRGRGRGRAGRGDVRTAILILLAEEPMHGYQLMQTIADRTQGAWTPSPGGIYPALNLLEDEGLLEIRAEGGRKLATLTEVGHAHVAEHRDNWVDPFQQSDRDDATPGVDLRGLLDEVRDATRQVARSGDQARVSAAAELLSRTRRELYLLLAGE